MDISQISSAANAAQSLSNLILVNPQKMIGYQPQNQPPVDNVTAPPPPTLVFDTEGENTATLVSEITDHVVEDNTHIQDHITLQPEQITVSGYIGELNNVIPRSLQAAKQYIDKLTLIGAYAPQLSISAQIAYNEAFQLYQTGVNAYNAGVAAYSSITGGGGLNTITGSGLTAFNAQLGVISGNQTKQQVAFQLFYGYWRSRTLFTIQTPWAIFKDMAIMSLRAIQGEDTRTITNFEVTFKMIRFAGNILKTGQTLTTSDNEGRLYHMSSDEVNNGSSVPLDVSNVLPQSDAIASSIS